MRYVIIGNSISGISAIEAIRENDSDGRITVISDEPYLNYSRPLISYLLGKKVGMERIGFREKGFYKQNKVELILDRKAISLDLNKKQVDLAGGKRINFDRLLIATGGVPIRLQIPGIDLAGVFSFTKLSDAQAIEKYIKTNKVKNAVVLGGGLIGLKATEALMELSIKVTIIEFADRILASTFDKQASGIIEVALGKAGCRLITNNTIIKIKNQISNIKNTNQNLKINSLILKDRHEINCDMVIVAIGVRPNIELAKDAPIKTDKGILVDNFMQTTVKDVYAAGDCCQALDSLSGGQQAIAIWPVAARQGKIAGYNMSGLKREYSGSFAMNSVELCGIPTISMGLTNPKEKEYKALERFAPEQSAYKKIVLRDNRITGIIFVGDIERVGIYTGLIKDKVDITSFRERLLAEDFGLINLPEEYRKHLVSGEVAII